MHCIHSDAFKELSTLTNNHAQMFSLVQDPPESSTIWEKIWHGRNVGRTREETSTCIKGVPKDFVASQPVPADSNKPLCLPAPKVVVSGAHNHLSYDPCYTLRHPPIVFNDYFANHSETAECQKAVTNLYNFPHNHSSSEEHQTEGLDLPLEEPLLYGWREIIARWGHPDLADEVINYWQTEANELLSRNVKKANLTIEHGSCGHLDPKTNKYIKYTLITSLSESCSRRYMSQQPHSYPDETPD